VAYGIVTKKIAATLETAGIRHLKQILGVGVNYKDSDDVPHNGYSQSNLTMSSDKNGMQIPSYSLEERTRAVIIMAF
jgi:hypothetical protein